jgi:hypothetical protein
LTRKRFLSEKLVQHRFHKQEIEMINGGGVPPNIYFSGSCRLIW